MENQQFQNLLDNLLEGCQVVDKNWRYLYVNNAAARQGRKTKDQLVGKTMMEVYPGIEKTLLFDKLRDCLENRNRHRLENEFEFPDGSKGWFELRLEPIREGLFILSLDISDRKDFERTKIEFVSLASHQLRTPLAAIKWTLELFAKEAQWSEEGQAKIKDLYTANERLIKLVNDLLSVSRIEAQARVFTPQVINLAELIGNSIALLKPRADARNQKIVLNPLPAEAKVNLDINLFAESLENILSDAIEYGFPGSVITIAVAAVGSVWQIAVHDRGSVIPPEERDKIFSKFFRGLEARQKHPGSSGLGLFIAKSAVEANGGRIWFESEQAAGTTFYFTVPQLNNNQTK